MIRHITKWAARIESPAEAPILVREAMRQLHEGRPRPVELEMAMDIMGQCANVELLPPKNEIWAPPVDEDQIKAAARLLGKAKRPLLVVGGGAIHAAAKILAIAEKLQAPVISKRNGKGIVSAKHYLHANLPMGHTLWGQADAVLAVGTRLKEPLTMWGKDDDLPLVRVDIDPVELTRMCVPEVGIVGDALVTLRALDSALDATNMKRESRHEELLTLRSKVEAQMRGHMAPQMAYLDTIRKQLPDDGVFVDEVTQVGFASWAGFPVYAPRQHVTASEMGTLGYGFATALGVTVGNPGKRVVQVSGDGGFMFNVQELSTAVQYRIPLTTVIFNDNCFGNVQRQQDEWFEGRRLCSDLHNPDFVKLAEVFGATGMRATSPSELGQALERSGQVQGPVLIEVPVTERMPTPWRFIMMPQNRKAVCA